MTKGAELLTDGSWVVVGLLVEGEVREPLAGSQLTLDAEAGRVGGSGGINRYMGAFSQGDLLFGPLATTMMAGPPPLMDQETTFLGLLARADAASTETGSLVLSADGSVLVVLEPAGTEQDSGNVK